MNEHPHAYTNGPGQDSSVPYDRFNASGSSFDSQPRGNQASEPLPPLPWPSKLYEDIGAQ